MHPRNPHRDGYDFPALVASSPELAAFVRPAPHGGDSIDFADAAAVKALNRALLKLHHGVARWDLPPGYLCPPIPGRADYIHLAADLLAADGTGTVPRGPSVVVLDVGVGANCIYPLIGRQAYGWRFVGSEIDPVARRHAEKLVRQNLPDSREPGIEIRAQASARSIFRGVIGPRDRFALSICNPPFHGSAAEAASGTRRKLRNLSGRPVRDLTLNFGGTRSELWCDGGELGFVRRMIAESAAFAAHVGWFTTLVSKRANLPELRAALARVHATDVRTLDMAQGQKSSRVLAWRFKAASPGSPPRGTTAG